MKVLLSTHPIASHFFPMIPLARQLLKHGHLVAFGSSNDFSQSINNFGFKALTTQPNWTEDNQICSVLRDQDKHIGSNHASYVVQNLFINSVGIKSIELMEKTIRTWKPNIVISEMTEFIGRLIAEKEDIAYASISFGIDLGKKNWNKIIGDSLNQIRFLLGLPLDRNLDHFIGKFNFCFAPLFYQPDSIPIFTNTHIFKPDLIDQLDQEELPTWFNSLSPLPIVYVTFGNAFGRIRWIIKAIIDGLSKDPINIISTVGKDTDTNSFSNNYENVYIEPYIPNSLLLPHCEIIISHAGYGTVMGALKAGIPMVLIPLGADQNFHAKRCEELGVAIVLNADKISPSEVRKSVKTVFNSPKYRIEAQKLKQKFNSAPSLNNAIRLLEKLFLKGKPV